MSHIATSSGLTGNRFTPSVLQMLELRPISFTYFFFLFSESSHASNPPVCLLCSLSSLPFYSPLLLPPCLHHFFFLSFYLLLCFRCILTASLFALTVNTYQQQPVRFRPCRVIKVHFGQYACVFRRKQQELTDVTFMSLLLIYCTYTTCLLLIRVNANVCVCVWECLHAVRGVNVLLPYVTLSVKKHLTRLIWYGVKHLMPCREVQLCRKTCCNFVN